MRQMVLGALLPALVLGALVLAGGADSLHAAKVHAKGGMGGGLTYMNVPQHPQYGYVVEQQSQLPVGTGNVVVNPYPNAMIWNVDDLAEWAFGGSLAVGESFTFGYPFMFDNSGHLLWINAVVGNGREFRLTISVPELAFSYSQDFTTSGRFCLVGGVPLSSPLLSPIPDSNGGVGLPITVQWTITATDRRGLGNSVGLNGASLYGNFSTKDTYCGGHNEGNGGYPVQIPGTDFYWVGP